MRDHGSSAPANPTDPDETQARAVSLDSIDPSGSARRLDFVAREEPLEIQLGPASLAVVMRTPGHDEELTLGFLVTERVVASPADVVSIRHCSTAPVAEAEDNIIRVTLAPHVEVDLAALRRNLFASSSCGICGKATIENALAVAPPLAGDRSEFRAATIRTYADALLREQDVFHATGGLHGAALFDPRGKLLVVREDVGRHNATDKVIGWAAAQGLLPLAGHALMVSGRISYEIVQKALAARIPLVAAVSAPTSLAIDLAEASGIALVGFLRGETMNVYANRARVVG
jgi:FdhD protein